MNADGSYYKGEFKDDKKHGKGLYMNANGSCHEGEYQNDKRHGNCWPLILPFSPTLPL